VRIRLDFLQPIKDLDADKYQLDEVALARNVCNLLLWDKGELYASTLCSSDYLKLERKALLGR